MQTHITQYGAPPTSIQEIWICLCSVLVRTCTICNVGSKPTFRTRKREVLNLTLINRNAENCISDWHVSDVPSFSDHMYIRFRV